MEDELFGLTEEEAVKLEEEGKNNFLVFPPSRQKNRLLKKMSLLILTLFSYF